MRSTIYLTPGLYLEDATAVRGGVVSGLVEGPRSVVDEMRVALVALVPLDSTGSLPIWIELDESQPLSQEDRLPPAGEFRVVGEATACGESEPVPVPIDADLGPIEILPFAAVRTADPHVPQLRLIGGWLSPAACEAMAWLRCTGGGGGGSEGPQRGAPTLPSVEVWSLPDTVMAALRSRMVATMQVLVPGAIGGRLKFRGRLVRQSLAVASPLRAAAHAVSGSNPGILLGRLLVQLSRSAAHGELVFPFLELSGNSVVPNTHKTTCESTCSASSSTVAQAAGAPYCCCGDVLHAKLRQGQAMWFPLSNTSQPLPYAVRCPLQLPLLGSMANGGVEAASVVSAALPLDLLSLEVEVFYG